MRSRRSVKSSPSYEKYNGPCRAWPSPVSSSASAESDVVTPSYSTCRSSTTVALLDASPANTTSSPGFSPTIENLNGARRCLMRASSASCSSTICSPVGVTRAACPPCRRCGRESSASGLRPAWSSPTTTILWHVFTRPSGKRKRPRNTAMPPISGANSPRASWSVSCGREDHRTLSALQGKSRDGVATNGWRRSGLPQGWQCHKNRAGCPKADTQVGISGHLARKADLGIGRRIPRPVFAAPKGVPFSPEKTCATVRPMC